VGQGSARSIVTIHLYLKKPPAGMITRRRGSRTCRHRRSTQLQHPRNDTELAAACWILHPPPCLDAGAHSPSTRVGVSRGRGRSQARPTPVSSTARSAVMALHQMGPAHQCSFRPV
jgi:hypothetical protein